METDRANLRLVSSGTPGAADALRGPEEVHCSPRLALERLNGVRLLSLDAHGRVLDWMNWQDAACLYARGAVAWTLGDPCLTIHGGTSRSSGEQSLLHLHPIVATTGHARARALNPTPALTNTALFARDAHLCLYCGDRFHRPKLTRDHVIPVSKGGRDIWENVVSACFHCNSRKGNRTPQQAHMPLLAVPYRPSWVEHLILSNRNILADQMAFLKSQLPKKHARALN
ncbi:HNH endonuclease [Novilysobacter spongiicola]|uniref:5-methylcytosine-specific restriction endonuclease McrA n=1 Tax=Lysobacter spongiicola DSM 21749 TaxID=1122188 RepID=A0A1T4N803_9GAMM|nr:HNH endonuclease [Lysobacter spongiicola]SJZ75332.1 5-methylcytosine-specific restriction endonuclease McrA [Lysobacter spongiicola DSM 21749]